MDATQGLNELVGPLTLRLPSMDVVGLGTCFVIGAMGGKAIALTAAHCVYAATSYDVPNRVASALGSPFQVETRQRTWNAIKLETTLSHRNVPPFMSLPVDVEAAFCTGRTDIAFLQIAPAEEYRAAVELDRQLGVCLGNPEVGERVVVVGFFETEVTSSHHRELDGQPAFQAIRAKFQAVETTVTEVLPEGVRDLKWPCFKLDCPLYSGMSGGCVLVKRGTRYVAIGVVSRDLSLDAVASGAEAYAATIEPALDTAIPRISYQNADMISPVQIDNILQLVSLGVIDVVHV